MADNRDARFNILQMVASSILVLGRQHGHPPFNSLHFCGPSPVDLSHTDEAGIVLAVRVRFVSVRGPLPRMRDGDSRRFGEKAHRMIRRLFNIFCGLNLLLCMAAAGVWISSYFVAVYLGYNFESDNRLDISNITKEYVSVGWGDGRVAFECVPSIIRSIATSPGFQWGMVSKTTDIHYPSPPTNSPRWLMNIFGIGWGSYNQPYRIHSVVFPAWIPVIFTAILPALWMIRRYRSRPYPPGFCQKCGYNLTGNVSGICPECGTAIAAIPAKPHR